MPPVIAAIAAVVTYASIIAGTATVVGGVTVGATIFGIEVGVIGASIIASVAAMGVSMAVNALLGGGPGKRASMVEAAAVPDPSQTLRQAIASHKLVVGEMLAGGAITFVDTNGGASFLSTTNNQYLVLVITLSGKPLTSMSAVFFGDVYVPLSTDGSGNAITPTTLPDGTPQKSFDSLAKIILGTGTVAGDAQFFTAVSTMSNKWTPDCKQGGRGKIVVQLKWDQTAFGTTGIPNIAVVCRGSRVFDPRDTPPATITTSTSASPGVISTSGAHGLAVGDLVWFEGHTATYSFQGQTKTLIGGPFEINTVPSSTSFSLVGPDSSPLTLAGGSGGGVTKMWWSDNSALVGNDYICDQTYGLNTQYDTEVTAADVISAANTCDERVARSSQTTTFTADASTDLITWALNQSAGDLPNFCAMMLTTTGTLPAGLSTGTVYFYSQSGATNTGKVCSSAASARSGTGIDITSAGSGTHTLQVVTTFTVDDVTRDEIVLYQSALRLVTGTKIRLASSGTLPAGLAAATDYYVLLVTPWIVRLATSMANARHGTYINITDAGTGTHAVVTVTDEPRFTANGIIDTSTDVQSIIQSIVGTMAGYLVPSGVKQTLLPGIYRTPTVTFSESDLRGPIKITALQSGQQSFNSVKGTFFDPFSSWQPTDVPSYTDATYVADDRGQIIWSDRPLPFTNSVSMAQRIFRIDLERMRREYTVTMPLKLSAFIVSAGDTIMITNSKWGLSSATFEISNWNFEVFTDDAGMPCLGVNVVARQTDSTVFSWSASNEKQGKRQATSQLPSAFNPKPPTSFTVGSALNRTIAPSGAITESVPLSWTAPADHFVTDGGFIDIQFKLSSSGTWIDWSSIPGILTSDVIIGLADGSSYDFQIRSRNTLGAVSAWVQSLNSTISGTATPAATFTIGGSALNSDPDCRDPSVWVTQSTGGYNPVVFTHDSAEYYVASNPSFVDGLIYQKRGIVVDVNKKYRVTALLAKDALSAGFVYLRYNDMDISDVVTAEHAIGVEANSVTAGFWNQLISSTFTPATTRITIRAYINSGGGGAGQMYIRNFRLEEVIDGGLILDAAISTPKIVDAAVTTVKVNDSAITTIKIADDAVTTPKIPTSNVVTSHMVSNAATIHHDVERTGPQASTGSFASILAGGVGHTSEAGVITINGCFWVFNRDTGSHNYRFEVRRDGSKIYPQADMTAGLTSINGSWSPVPYAWVETPGAGSYTYDVVFKSTDSTTALDAYNAVLNIDEIKR